MILGSIMSRIITTVGDVLFEDDPGVKEPWLYVIQILGLDTGTVADMDMDMWAWTRFAFG